MRRRALAVLTVAMAGLVAVVVTFETGQATAGGYLPTTDLFYNYYVPPCTYGGVGAELYVCPRPTPPYVGHTYVTYQGLMPHEFLYKHHRCYWTQHSNCTWTRTVISWQ